NSILDNINIMRKAEKGQDSEPVILEGLTHNYVRVFAQGQPEYKGKIFTVNMERAFTEHAEGSIAE
ncbi:MAG: hypothetical protein PHG48_06465, partial [Eubacteriales bacterium]|nr:hypothetical protein [Eubacteriales bacterium]